MSHRFQVSQFIRLRERLLEYSGIFEVIRLLPPGFDDEPLYRIKAVNGPIYRLVREGDMVAVESTEGRN
ncbi:MAG: hypothetical protein ABW026_05225 [Microvirga sp.]